MTDDSILFYIGPMFGEKLRNQNWPHNIFPHVRLGPVFPFDFISVGPSTFLPIIICFIPCEVYKQPADSSHSSLQLLDYT